MVVTTAGKNDVHLRQKTKRLADSLSVRYVDRGSESIETLKKQYNDDVLMIGKEKIVFHAKGGSTPFFFHPNSAMFRVKQVLRGEKDPFIKAAGILNGTEILDCTLGLASDAIIASIVSGNDGRVVGLEESEAIAFIVNSGLKSLETGIAEMDQAMRNIQVMQTHHLDFLKAQKDNTFDVVYFDPMFERTISSPGLKGLKESASYETLSRQAVIEAIRVARKRVVLKDHRKSKLFKEYGFTAQERSSDFWYGVIDKAGH